MMQTIKSILKITISILVLCLLDVRHAFPQNVPISQMQDGGQILATDLIHISRCDFVGCDYKAHVGTIGAANTPLGISLGGTGLTTIGASGTCFVSNGLLAHGCHAALESLEAPLAKSNIIREALLVALLLMAMDL